MKYLGAFAIAIGVLILAGSTSAQTDLTNTQLADEWVRCQKGQTSTIGDCSSIRTEFNRRANQIRQQDARIQRGEAVPAATPPRPTTPQTSPAPQATPAPRPTTPPSTAPARPSNRPQQTTPNLSGSEAEASCEGRQVLPAPGGYMCF